jgi:hypothetical protein
VIIPRIPPPSRERIWYLLMVLDLSPVDLIYI